MVLLEVVWVYGAGLTIRLSAREARPISRVLASQLQTEWPNLQGPVLRALRPLVQQQVAGIVNEVTVDIGGIRVILPQGLRRQLAMDLNRAISHNMEDALAHHFNPATLITPKLVAQALQKPVAFRVWVDVWRLPVPVNVRVGG